MQVIPVTAVHRGFASVVAVPAWAGFMKAATTGNKPEWIQVPSGISHIRRCRASGGLATEYCELTHEVDNDIVSVGRTPEICTQHSSSADPATTTAPLTAISYIRPPQ